MRFYIASRLENAETVKKVADILKSAGHIHTYDWTVHGSVQNEGQERIAEVAHNEVSSVITADLVIVILPGGRGTHTELGLAILAAINRRTDIIICAENDDLFMQDERTCAFYWHKSVTKVTGSIDEWLIAIFEKIRLAERCIWLEENI